MSTLDRFLTTTALVLITVMAFAIVVGSGYLNREYGLLAVPLAGTLVGSLGLLVLKRAKQKLFIGGNRVSEHRGKGLRE